MLTLHTYSQFVEIEMEIRKYSEVRNIDEIRLKIERISVERPKEKRNFKFEIK